MPAAARRFAEMPVAAAANPVALLHAELRERLAETPTEWAVAAPPLARRRIAPLVASGTLALAVATVFAMMR